MSPVKKDDAEITPSTRGDVKATPLTEDPYALMRRQFEFLLQRLDSIEAQVGNLQVTWDRILNIAQEQPLRQSQPQQPCQQPYQQPYDPYQQQPIYGQQAQMPVEDMRPKWEKEPEVKPKKKLKLGKKSMLMIAAIVIVLIVYMYLKAKGYGISLPGMG